MPASSDTTGVSWERHWPVATCSYMAQHRVGSTPLAPGTGYLCMVREAVVAELDLQMLLEPVDARFTAMLFLDEGTPIIQVNVGAQEPNSHHVSIQSWGAGSQAVHAMVLVTLSPQPTMVMNACSELVVSIAWTLSAHMLKSNYVFPVSLGFNNLVVYIYVGHWVRVIGNMQEERVSKHR